MGQERSRDSHSHPPSVLLPAHTPLREEENRRPAVARNLVALDSILEGLQPGRRWRTLGGCKLAAESTPHLVVEGNCCSRGSRTLARSLARSRVVGAQGTLVRTASCIPGYEDHIGLLGPRHL